MTNVKICGITNFEDAEAAANAGADLLGFIFYEPSPRYVQPDAVKAILRQPFFAEKPKPLCVGVFVDEAPETIRQIVDYTGLDAVQLHGDEPPEVINKFQGRAYKALRPQSRQEATELVEKYTPCAPATGLPCFLLDAYHPSLYGGTGHVTDWTMAANLTSEHSVMLAGSLTPENVVDAIRLVAPWGVDVSSGVEAEKGKKDHKKVMDFIQKVRGMDIKLKDQPAAP